MRTDWLRALPGRFAATLILPATFPRKNCGAWTAINSLLWWPLGEAFEQSGLHSPPEDPYRCGIVVGSGIGGLATIEAGVRAIIEKGSRAIHPLTIPKAVINLAPGMLSIKYGFKGPNFGLVNACTSGTSAIGEAFRMVREGRADVMLTGGTEAVVTVLLHRRRSTRCGPCPAATRSPRGLLVPSTWTGMGL